MLKPNNIWKWYFDTKLNALMLDLGQEMIFRVTIEKKNLVPDAFTPCSFSVDDAALFNAYKEEISHIDLSEPRKTELVLNAVAARRFHKPFLPKSWYFHPQGEEGSPEEGAIVELVTEFGTGQFIVIENTGNASLCMLAQELPFELNENKTMHFCDAIKVMNDRIFITPKARLQQRHSFDMVG